MHDVVIVGVGPVGGALALALADADLDIVALDARAAGAIDGAELIVLAADPLAWQPYARER